MEDSLGRRIHELMRQAFELEGPGRRALIETACAADPRLEKRRFRLLAAIDDSQSFLDRPALANPAPSSLEAPPPVPERIGNYRIVRAIGSGGMGTVYEAIQDQPRRTVALKIPHRRGAALPGGLSNGRAKGFNAPPAPSADSRSAGLPPESQFSQLPLPSHESEVLARLRHPAIAQVYEAGSFRSPKGDLWPYFAMEFVPDARRLTDYARDHGLGVRARLELFRQVCAAIQHGHRLGVIHRDLKPANILVGSDGQPKVIDFGVARSDVHTNEAGSSPGSAGPLVGTLNYISPEQFSGDPAIDARTDVYSLGVVLFELLCGDLPHQLSGLPLGEAFRKLREDAPRRPRVFQPRLPDDLEAIVLKAIARDPDLRYASADALGSDVQRYLDGRPVEAWPPTAGYQLRKFVRRNRVLSGTLAAMAALLLTGSLVTGRLAWVAQRARIAAEQRESELETVTEFQESLLRDIDVAGMGDRLKASLAESVAASAPPDENPTAGQSTVELLDALTARVNYSSLAIRFLRENLLERYARSIEGQFADQPLIKARLLQRLAGTCNTLGLYADAEPSLREALRIRRAELGEDDADTLLTLHSLGSLLSTLGRPEEAVPLLTDAHRRRVATLGAEHEDTLRTSSSLGGALRKLGNLTEAEKIWTQTLAAQRRVLGDDDADTLRTLNNLGVVYAWQGRLADAERVWRELLERRRRVLGPDDPDYRGSLGNLGTLLQDQGKLDEARPLLEEALAADRRHHGDLHSETLVSMTQLAALQFEAGETEAAESLQRECVAGRRASFGSDDPATLRAEGFLASIQHSRGDSDAAETLLTSVLATQRRVLGDDDADTIHSLYFLSRLLADQARFDEALPLSAEALAHARATSLTGPLSLGEVLSSHGQILLDSGDSGAALATLREAHDVLSRSFGPDHPKTKRTATLLNSCEAGLQASGH